MQNEPLTPGLLVSMPNLNDPYFQKSVILLCDYTEETAFGVVINRPSPICIRDILTEDADLDADENSPILIGGPVQPELLWALHSTDFEGQSTTKLDVTVSLSSVQDVLTGIAEGRGPHTYQLGFGYAGWGPGQLDQELQEGAWWVAPMDAELVLHMPFNRRWETVLQRLGINPFMTSYSDPGQA